MTLISTRARALALGLGLVAVLALSGGVADADVSKRGDRYRNADAPARTAPDRVPGHNAQADPATTPAPDAGGADSDSRPTGSVNPLAISNPFCEQRLRAPERRNCAASGTPEGRYPTSNYGFDVHIDTGVDNIVGNFQALLAQIANAIWQACLFVFNLVLTLLGWAFALTPFSDNATIASIDRGLEGFYAAFTEPWLVLAMVAIGAVGMWRGVVRREVSASIAATVLSLVLMVGALWILHEPRASVGKLAGLANDTALTVLAAPQGQTAQPKASYAQATAEVWHQVTVPGFAALNFSDPDWALSAPDPELLETADEYLCVDAAYLAQIPPRRWAQLRAAQESGEEVSCDQLVSSLPAPRTNAEMYLRSSPGSLAREKLWSEHTDDAPYSSHFAIQGDDGAWTRLPLVIVIALGLLGGICLLSWLALRLMAQAAVAFVLVLLTPLALFMPAFGERGRAAFALWGGALLGALISKLVYAALLAVILFASTVVSDLVGEVGAMVAFLITAGIWWAVFLRREALVSFISVSSETGSRAARGSRMLGLESAVALGRRLAVPLSGGTGAGVQAARSVARRASSDRSAAGRATARASLDQRAGARLDARLASERQLIGSQDARREQVRSLGAQRVTELRRAGAAKRAGAVAPDPSAKRASNAARTRALARANRLAGQQASLRQGLVATSPRETRARAFVAEAEERQRRRGQRWSAKDLADAREALRSEADRPVTDRAHAWRVGMSPERYGALAGAERDRAHAEVAGQLRADRAALGAIPNRPDGIVERAGERRWRSELRRQPGGERALRDARRHATHRRRARRQSAIRRGVSR